MVVTIVCLWLCKLQHPAFPKLAGSFFFFSFPLPFHFIYFIIALDIYRNDLALFWIGDLISLRSEKRKSLLVDKTTTFRFQVIY